MQYVHGENSAEQNKSHNTYEMAHYLGEIQNRIQRIWESTENCNHNDCEREKNDTQKRETWCIVIESIPFSTEIRFPRKQGRKSQMPKPKMTNQDLSFISYNSLPFNQQHKCL